MWPRAVQPIQHQRWDKERGRGKRRRGSRDKLKQKEVDDELEIFSEIGLRVLCEDPPRLTARRGPYFYTGNRMRRIIIFRGKRDTHIHIKIKSRVHVYMYKREGLGGGGGGGREKTSKGRKLKKKETKMR